MSPFNNSAGSIVTHNFLALDVWGSLDARTHASTHTHAHTHTHTHTHTQNKNQGEQLLNIHKTQ